MATLFKRQRQITARQKEALAKLVDDRLEWTPRGFGYRDATEPGVSPETAQVLVRDGEAEVIRPGGGRIRRLKITPLGIERLRLTLERERIRALGGNAAIFTKLGFDL